MGYIVASFFLLWFGFSVLYSLNPGPTGQLGKLLRRYGWIRQWAMYTKQYSTQGAYDVYIAEVSQPEDPLSWTKVYSPFSNQFNLLLNPGFRFNFFVAKCIRKLSANKRKGNTQKLDLRAFDYLCHVLSENTRFKHSEYIKVKVVYAANGQRSEELIESDLIEIPQYDR